MIPWDNVDDGWIDPSTNKGVYHGYNRYVSDNNWVHREESEYAKDGTETDIWIPRNRSNANKNIELENELEPTPTDPPPLWKKTQWFQKKECWTDGVHDGGIPEEVVFIDDYEGNDEDNFPEL